MRQAVVVAINILIAATAYLWISFFLSADAALPFVGNQVLTFLAFGIFVLHLTWQLIPSASSEVTNRVLLSIVSAIFIPLLIICFAHTYRALGVEDAKSNSDFIYFSVVTFTTLGYGDLSPTGEARIFAVLQAISGFLFVPLLISQLLNTTKEAREDMRRRNEELEEIRQIVERND